MSSYGGGGGGQGIRVYVGGLDTRITEKDLEDEFVRFGHLKSVWVARKPPGFAFIEFDDQRDAEDAVRKLDGHQGWRVEFSRSRDRGPPGGGAPGGGGGGARGGFGGPPGRGEMKCYECGELGHLARDCRARGGGGGGGGGSYGGGGGGYGGGGGGGYGGGGGGYGGGRDAGRDAGRDRGRDRSRSPVRRRSPSYEPRDRRSPSYSPAARSRSRSRARD